MKEPARYAEIARQMRTKLRDRVFEYALANRHRLKWKRAAYALAYGASVYDVGRDFMIYREHSQA
ncbi:MAG: hypothetical protein EOQ89_03675 [Mesorhizobium sp.]|nr:MAG: hypothetical protein EOQ89_03675 [Mesorhizobium sp.]